MMTVFLRLKVFLRQYSNMILAHESKTKLMLFTSRASPELPENKFYNVVLECCDSVKYWAGLLPINRSSFDSHIISLRLKLNKIRRIFNIVWSLLSRDSY